MNLCSALTACCFFDNKPEALPVHIEKSRQLELFLRFSYPELAYTFNDSVMKSGKFHILHFAPYMPIDVSCFHFYSIVPLHRQSERLIRQTIHEAEARTISRHRTGNRVP